jgi:signal transduction histidine kinase/CheY-like chemotaxis protein
VKTIVLRFPASKLFTAFSLLKAIAHLRIKRLTGAAAVLIRANTPLRKTLLRIAVTSFVIALTALGFVIGQAAHQRVESEEGARLQAEATYFKELLDQTVGQHITDLESRAALLPKFDLHHDDARLNTWIKTVKAHITDYAWIGFASSNGVLVASNEPTTTGTNVRQTAWFQLGQTQSGAVKSFESISGKRHMLPKSSHLIELATPVRSDNDVVIGVLSAHLNWDWLLRQHQRLESAVVRPQRSAILIAGRDGLGELLSTPRETIDVHALHSFQRARSGYSGWHREIWPDQKEYLVGYASSMGAGQPQGSGWVTLIRIPSEGLHPLLSPILHGLWQVIAVAAVGFVLLTYLLLRITLQPVEQLVSTVNAAAVTGRPIELNTPAPKEFQVLARAMNELADAVNARKTAEQAKSRLIADMSHEIRTPLHGLIGHAELLKARLSSHQDREDIDQLIRCAKEMTELVNDAIDLSSLELNQLQLDARPTLLHDIVKFNTEIFRSVAIQKNLFFDVETKFDANLCLMADRLRIGQILRNLFSNAVKFTSSGGIHVMVKASPITPPTINASPHESGRVMVEVDVMDSGVGMSDRQQRVIFQPFRRISQDHPAIHGHMQTGSGLGLSVTKGLVESMGGHIALTSQPGVGTRVSIQLPLPTATATPDVSVIPLSTTPQPGLRIVLVDDAEQNRDVMRRWLELHHHQVIAVSTADAAMEALSRQTVDVILMDIDLPGINGWDAARLVRANGGANARATIFALSGRAFEGDRQESIAAGIDQHINKPIDFDRFRDQLATVVRNTFGSA